MFHGNPNFEQLQEQILEPSSVELTITVTPVIYSVKRRHYEGDRIPATEGEIPIWQCLFEIRSGKDRAYSFSTSAFGSHTGDRQGPQWRRTVKLWQKQYDYIRQYIGSAILNFGTILVEEASLATRNDKYDWEPARKEIWAILGTLENRYWEEQKGAREEGDWDRVASLDASARAVSVAMKPVALLFGRLRRMEYLHVGKSKSPLRFSFDQIERLHTSIKAYQELWKSAAAISDSKYSANNYRAPSDEQWIKIKAEINQVCPLPDNKRPRLGSIPDDLLDELRPKRSKRRYNSYQLAYVHAAIECGFVLAGPSWPKAQNWRVISDALQGYRNSIGEPSE